MRTLNGKWKIDRLKEKKNEMYWKSVNTVNEKWKNGKRNEMKKCEVGISSSWLLPLSRCQIEKKKTYWLQTSNERPSTKSEILIVFKFHIF